MNCKHYFKPNKYNKRVRSDWYCTRKENDKGDKLEMRIPYLSL